MNYRTQCDMVLFFSEEGNALRLVFFNFTLTPEIEKLFNTSIDCFTDEPEDYFDIDLDGISREFFGEKIGKQFKIYYINFANTMPAA